MAQIVPAAEAARRLGVNRSSIKRYLDRYPELVSSTDGRTKYVDPDRVAAHREENINPAIQHNHAGEPGIREEPAPPSRPPDAALPEDALDETLAGEDGQQPTTQSEAYRRYNLARARRQELEYEKEIGNVVPREEVERAVRQASQLLREQAATSARKLADKLASLDAPSDVRAAIQARDQELLKAFADGLSELVNHDNAG